MNRRGPHFALSEDRHVIEVPRECWKELYWNYKTNHPRAVTVANDDIEVGDTVYNICTYFVTTTSSKMKAFSTTIYLQSKYHNVPAHIDYQTWEAAEDGHRKAIELIEEGVLRLSSIALGVLDNKER